MAETNTSNKEEGVTQKWDSRLGEWAPLDDNNDIKLPSYSRLLSNEETIFITREYRLCNRDNSGNRYLIKNSLSENLFYGEERSNCSNNLCMCVANRAFDLTFYDKNREPSLSLYRPFRFCCCGLIPWCRQKIEIKDKFNKIIGRVNERFNLLRFVLNLKLNQTELQINGPNCEAKIYYCLDDICFNIYNKTDTGKGRKRCGHICKLSDFTSGGHIFRVKFANDWSPEIKSIVIGATLLIDYYFYDNTYHQNKYHNLTISSATETLPPFPSVVSCDRDVDKSRDQT